MEHYAAFSKLPAVYENDVNAAVRGYCAQHGQKDTAYIYFPQKYEPGAGFFINGAVYKGARGFAGEIGSLPIGVNWRKLNYAAFAPVCEAVAKVAGTLAAVLDVETVVLSGEFLTPRHLEHIAARCAALVAGPPPRLTLSADFSGDYAAGMIQTALELLRAHCAAQTNF